MTEPENISWKEIGKLVDEHAQSTHSHNPSKLLDAAYVLRTNFSWQNTPEGVGFWSYVHKRLRDIAKSAAGEGND